ncbi:MAG: PKD domain-containing protein, partial [Bacteroidia bacterium]
ITIPANGTADYFAWFDVATGGAPLAYGPNYTPSTLSATTTLYVEGRNETSLPTLPISAGFDSIDNSNISNYYTVNNDRGLLFETTTAFLLDSVSIFTQGSFSGQVELYENSTLLLSKTINLNQAGPNAVFLGFEVPISNALELRLANPSGAKIYIDLPIIFPLNYGPISITAGTPLATHYNYFYDWKIKPLFCASARTPVTITVLQTPALNLGEDTSFCQGSITLDATFPGASYSWNTTATTPTLTVTTTGLYSVSSTIGSCSSTDSINVEVLGTPGASVLADTTVCGPQTIMLSPTHNGSTIGWYDSASGGNLLFVGEDYPYSALGSTTLYMESWIVAQQAIIPTQAGFQNPGSSSSGSQFVVNNDRGINFSSQRDFLLESVSLAGSIGLSGTIALYDGPSLLASKAVTLTQAGGEDIFLGFDIPASNQLSLILENPQNGTLFIDLPITNYPFNYGGLSIVEGTPIANHYNYFYDWKIVPFFCPSTRTPIGINVLPSPIVELLEDTLVCGSSLVLDVSNPNATYLWSTTETTSNITVTTSANYSVVVSIGQCEVLDNISVEILPPPVSPPIVTDTTICGEAEITLSASSTSNGEIYWYDDSVSRQVLGIGNSFTAFVEDTTIFYPRVEQVRQITQLPTNAGFNSPFSSTGGYFSIINNRGIDFESTEDFTLESVDIYIEFPPLSGNVILYENGVPVGSKEITLTDWGKNTVFLGYKVDKGQSMRLNLEDTEGAELRINFPVVYPLQYGAITMTGGFPVLDHYNYFFNWKIKPETCASEPSQLQVDVKYILELPNYIYSCEDTTLETGLVGTHLWSTGSSNTSITVDSSGIYTVSIDDGLGCIVNGSTEVEIPNSSGLQDDGILCGTELITNYDSTAIFSWSTGDTVPVISITNPGTYSVLIQEPRGCVLYDTITVTGFDTFPMVDLGDDIIACDSALLDAGNPGLSFWWNSGQTTQTIVPKASGNYIVNVTNTNNCLTSDTIGVLINPSPQASFNSNIFNQSVSFINSSTFGTYLWNFGDNNSSQQISPTHTYLSGGVYTVMLIATNECGNDTFTQEVVIFNTSLERDLLLQNLKIYPNPTQSLLHIDWEGLPGGDKLEFAFYNTMGQLLWTDEMNGQSMQWERSINNYPAGIYKLQVRQGDTQITVNIVKE